MALIIVECPVPVELAAFTVERSGETAVLRWAVTDAVDHAGFHVYREPPGGPRERLTAELLRGSTEYTFVDPLAPAGGAAYYLAELDRAGSRRWHGPVQLEATRRQELLVLDPARPNPFSTGTVIPYRLAGEGAVTIEVFDALGRRVRTLLSGTEPSGSGSVEWDGRAGHGGRVAAGLYLIRVRSGGISRVQRVVMTN